MLYLTLQRQHTFFQFQVNIACRTNRSNHERNTTNEQYLHYITQFHVYLNRHTQCLRFALKYLGPQVSQKWPASRPIFVPIVLPWLHYLLIKRAIHESIETETPPYYSLPFATDGKLACEPRGCTTLARPLQKYPMGIP